MRIPLSGWSLMNRLRINCSTGMCWLAHSMRRLPASASARFFTSALAFVAVSTGFPFDWCWGEKLACRHGRATRCRFFLDGFRFVSALPGEAGAGAAEVAVRRRRAINRTAQVERLNDSLWCEFEERPH